MPRRNRRKQREADFEIHVDSSCLSAPMEEKNEVADVSVKEVGAAELASPTGGADDVHTDAEILEQQGDAESDKEADTESDGKDEDAKSEAEDEKPVDAPTPETEHEPDEAEIQLEEKQADAAIPEADEPVEEPVDVDKQEPPETSSTEAASAEANESLLDDADQPKQSVEVPEPEQEAEVAETVDDADQPRQSVEVPEPEEEPKETKAVDDSMDEVPAAETKTVLDVEDEHTEAPEAATEHVAKESQDEQEDEHAEEVDADTSLVTVDTEASAPALEEMDSSEIQSEAAESASPEQARISAALGDADTQASYSRRESGVSSATRSSSRTSKRTEELIQAAARDIVAQMQRNSSRDSFRSSAGTERSGYTERSSTRSSRTHVQERGSMSRQSYVSESRTMDDAGDSSSHHDDDVFSDHSPRSSMGSASENDHKKMSDDMSYRSRSPRISNISQYDREEDFVPTVRGTPRPPFRSPSSVKAMQMSSPPASVIGSPRSSRRTPLPTVSRMGSPSLSAQYSPKKTPPRFRRTTPPLVLLHVTLLPLRWAWGDVLDNAQTDDLTEETKTLREAWRQLQDRLGDTVCERGILLPHPQSDYEILEERLMEALELPMRRRARILECGHYLGPSNDHTLTSDAESEDDDDGNYYDGVRAPRDSMDKRNKTHWCSTCRSDIRYDALGPDKIFRVKVYASNGLMKAGAWEACWKEMERVDVELEPIVDSNAQDALNRLAVEQEQALELREVDDVDEMIEHEEEEEEEEEEENHHQHHQHHEEEHVESSFMEHQETQPQLMPSSPPPPEIIVSSSPPTYEERRRREEERLKEIYGGSPPPPPPASEPEQPPSPPRSPEYMHHESPPPPSSPSGHAYERREERRHAVKNDSLPELLLEAARVLMQDRKNVMIMLLSVFVLMFALRGGSGGNLSPPGPDPRTFQTLVQSPEVSTVTVTQAAVQHATVDHVEEMPSASSATIAEAVSAATSQVVESSPSTEAHIPVDPVEVEAAAPPPAVPEPETVVSEKVVRVVQTVTQTETAVETVKVTATYTQTETQTESVVPLQSETMVLDERVADSAEEEEEMENLAVEVEHADVQVEQAEVEMEYAEVQTEQPELEMKHAEADAQTEQAEAEVEHIEVVMEHDTANEEAVSDREL